MLKNCFIFLKKYQALDVINFEWLKKLMTLIAYVASVSSDSVSNEAD